MKHPVSTVSRENGTTITWDDDRGLREIKVFSHGDGYTSVTMGAIDSSSSVQLAPAVLPEFLAALRHALDLSSAAEHKLPDAGPSQARGHGVVESLRGTEDGESFADELDRLRGEAA